MDNNLSKIQVEDFLDNSSLLIQVLVFLEAIPRRLHLDSQILSRTQEEDYLGRVLNLQLDLVFLVNNNSQQQQEEDCLGRLNNNLLITTCLDNPSNRILVADFSARHKILVTQQCSVNQPPLNLEGHLKVLQEDGASNKTLDGANKLLRILVGCLVSLINLQLIWEPMDLHLSYLPFKNSSIKNRYKLRQARWSKYTLLWPSINSILHLR